MTGSAEPRDNTRLRELEAELGATQRQVELRDESLRVLNRRLVALEHFEGLAEGLAEECRLLSERVAQLERELRSAKAEVEVKNEFVASLEAELEETLGYLRAKTAYIESLPWVRVRAWEGRRRHRSEP